jgi:Protein of unknown function (DUF3617)
MFQHRFSSALFLVCAVGAAGAQSATPAPVPAPAPAPAAAPSAPPPIKMGLWETTVTTQMSGFQLPPDVMEKLKQMGRDVPGEPHTMVSQGCLTPDEWQKSIEAMNKPRQSDCSVTKHGDDVRSLSFDVSCKMRNGGSITGHWEMHVVDDEHGQGSGHMKGDQMGANGQSFSMDSTMDSHYLGADCGDVKPGEPKIIKE